MVLFVGGVQSVWNWRRSDLGKNAQKMIREGDKAQKNHNAHRRRDDKWWIALGDDYRYLEEEG